MKLPRDLDAQTLVHHLARRWGYVPVRQTGSHIRLRIDTPIPHFITVPAHSPLKPGTLASILKDIAAHKSVPLQEILAGL